MIEQLGFKSKVFLAPMAGITDKPMRQLVSSFGAGNMISEMIAINAIQHKNPKTYRIADVRNETYPVVVQLVGGEPELFADVVQLIENLGASSIDINMGCPVKKIVNNHSGSYLMQNINLASKIIETTKKPTNLKVSAKFRLGWDHQHINVIEFAQMCEESGASYITVHGRTRSDFYSGKADWDMIAQVKQAVSIPVIGNGDIIDTNTALEMLKHTNVDGIMIGRAALGKPWLIAQIHNFLCKHTPPKKITSLEIKQTFLKHLHSLIDYYGESLGLPLSRKYAGWYSHGLREAKRFREAYNHINNLIEAEKEINNFFDNCFLTEKEENK